MATDIISRTEAQARGLKRYFTGIACRHGHIVERWSGDGRCVECRFRIESKKDYLARHKHWRVENPEKSKATQKRWRDKNLVKITVARKKRYSENSDEMRAASRKRYADNPAKALALVKRWRRENLDRSRANIKKWLAKNPEKPRLYQNHRRALKIRAGGSHTSDQILDLFKKQKGKCASCFCSIKCGYHCDHIAPLSKGGSNDINNIQLLCQPCNNRKHAKDPIVWAWENGRLI